MKSQKKIKLPNDFERMIPEYHKGGLIYGEHIIRYEGCVKFIKNKVVLDIASGSGYGTAILAKSAEKVYGVDISADSIQYAKENYAAKNIKYLVGDGENIPLPNSSIDTVVSFETIEHVKDYEQFIKEIKRVLKPNGQLIISTPNDIEFAEGNHFHLHEFKYQELKKLLRKYFKSTESYFQGTWTYSALLPESMLSKEWEKDIKTRNVAPLTIDQALYFFLICSESPIKTNLDPLGAISGHYSERKLQEKEKLTLQHVQNLQVIADNRANEIKIRDKQIKQLESHLHRIFNSKSWQLARAVAKVKQKLSMK